VNAKFHLNAERRRTSDLGPQQNGGEVEGLRSEVRSPRSRLPQWSYD